MKHLRWLVPAVLVAAGGIVVYQLVFSLPGYVDDGDLIYPLDALEDDVTFVNVEDYGLADAWESNLLYIVRHDTGYRVLEAVTPHAGCVVAYDDEDDLFFDPCHSTRYSRTGETIEGIGDYDGMRVFAFEVVDDHLRISGRTAPWALAGD